MDRFSVADDDKNSTSHNLELFVAGPNLQKKIKSELVST